VLFARPLTDAVRTVKPDWLDTVVPKLELVDTITP
jgi:hypothetical protein